MRIRPVTLIFFILSSLLFASYANAAEQRTRGIYINQSSAENSRYINYLIERSKEVGINTFVIDYERSNKHYEANIQQVKKNGIRYVARVVVFPKGGDNSQILSQAYWEKRYKLVESAINLGADSIQLDYIRYRPTQAPSHQNAENILTVIKWFKNKVEAHKIPLQVDVFGIASFGESKYIGQDLKLIGPAVDAMCPMLYPSHFEPYKTHAVTPYRTVYSALQALKTQLNNNVSFKLYPYIEMTNYRFRHPQDKIQGYIYAQIKATEDANSDGWFAWSAGNKYDNLFLVMKNYPVKS